MFLVRWNNFFSRRDVSRGVFVRLDLFLIALKEREIPFLMSSERSLIACQRASRRESKAPAKVTRFHLAGNRESSAYFIVAARILFQFSRFASVSSFQPRSRVSPYVSATLSRFAVTRMAWEHEQPENRRKTRSKSRAEIERRIRVSITAIERPPYDAKSLVSVPDFPRGTVSALPVSLSISLFSSLFRFLSVVGIRARVRVCVRVRVGLRVCIRVRVGLRVCIQIRIGLRVCVPLRVRVREYVHVQVRVHLRVRVRVPVRVLARVRVRVREYVHVQIRVHLRVRVEVRVRALALALALLRVRVRGRVCFFFPLFFFFARSRIEG